MERDQDVYWGPRMQLSHEFTQKFPAQEFSEIFR